MTNNERAERACRALECYPGDPDDLAATIVALVTDLMHLAFSQGIEPDYIAHTSADHYDAEVNEKVTMNPEQAKMEAAGYRP